MAKSFKKTKIFGNCGGSEKQDKQLCSRALRSKVKRQLKHGDPDAPMPLPNEVRNTWSMTKDGKSYWKEASKRDMRK